MPEFAQANATQNHARETEGEDVEGGQERTGEHQESWRSLLLRAHLLQDLHELRALVELREHQRRGAAVGAGVRVGARLQERLDARGRASAFDGPEERGRAVFVLRLHVAAGGGERLEDLGAGLALRSEIL